MKAGKIPKQRPDTTSKDKRPSKGSGNPVQQQGKDRPDESPRVSQLKAYQRMADHYTARMPQLGGTHSSQPLQKKEALSGSVKRLTFATKTHNKTGPVAQLVKVKVPMYSNEEIDTDNVEQIEELIESLDDDDILDQVRAIPELVEAINRIKPDTIEIREDPSVIRERAKADKGGWFKVIGESQKEKEKFLNDTIRVARHIIPKAFNRAQEVGNSKTPDYINTAYAVKDALVGAYAQDLIKGNVMVTNKYIHPAALERLYTIVKETAPNHEAKQAPMVGVCKDFASLVYGLILQNDREGTFKPKLSLMFGHVYVEVDIDGKPYAVDAWLNGEVLPKALHEQRVAIEHPSIKPLPPTLDISAIKAKPKETLTEKEQQIKEEQFAKVRTLKDEAGYNESLETNYNQADEAKLIWYQNEARYRKLAISKWTTTGKSTHPNRGSA